LSEKGFVMGEFAPCFALIVCVAVGLLALYQVKLSKIKISKHLSVFNAMKSS